MAINARIKVAGLKEFQTGLRKLNPELDKALKSELKDVAEHVLHDAQGSMPVKSGRALESMKAGADSKGPFVSGGKKSVPYYGWLDFGSRTPKRGRPRSVGPWKGTGAGPKKGRIIYPAIDRNRDLIERRAAEALQTAKNASSL